MAFIETVFIPIVTKVRILLSTKLGCSAQLTKISPDLAIPEEPISRVESERSLM